MLFRVILTMAWFLYVQNENNYFYLQNTGHDYIKYITVKFVYVKNYVKILWFGLTENNEY